MPRALDFALADVFTDRPFGGNPLAVFPRVRELAAETMQAIARELNLSETTFVFRPAEAGVTCTVRIFNGAAVRRTSGPRVSGTSPRLPAHIGSVPPAEVIARL